jgi:hypothetical protein
MPNNDRIIKMFGDYQTDLPPSCQKELTILVSPMAFPVDWSLAGVTANFLASYFDSFFPASTEEQASTQLSVTNLSITNRAEAWDAISYIANELVENAVKFHHDKRVVMEISLKLYADRLVLIGINSVDPAGLGKFYAFIQDLTSADPKELYIRHLEEGLASLENTTSGVGFLTIMADYEAKIGWKFEIIDVLPKIVTVTTMVQWPIVKESLSNDD